jgi:hypothetical protein
MKKQMNKQKGGLDTLVKVPIFKYTFNEKRKLFIGYLYPYAEYFVNCVRSIPFDSYSYHAECEYIDNEDENNKVQKVLIGSNNNSPLYFFTGGCAYEILNNKFKNVDLHKYCDATGDIDVSLYPPNITYSEYGNIFFFNINNKISLFYSHFTKWVFDYMVKNIEHIQSSFSHINNMIEFDIDEYDEIPNNHKHSDFGYNNISIGKFHVVSFLNEDISMFKIQVVCKIKDSNDFVIDHVIEIIIPLPESDISYSPSGDSYRKPNINIIELNTKTYNIQDYGYLIDDNISAYVERIQVYGKSNERNYIHKPINHIARIFYLFEFIYQNENDIQNMDNIPLLFLPLNVQDKKEKKIFELLENLYYYKIVDGSFHSMKVNTRYFLNSYLKIIKKNTYLYKLFIKKKNYSNYFIQNSEDNQLLHDKFNSELFNNDLFQPSGILTFSDDTSTSGGSVFKKKSRKFKKRKMRKTKKRY